MRRIVITEFISLDGVIDSPGGEPGYPHSGWTMRYQDDEGFAYKLQEVMDHDALLLGRVTYEGFAAAWPGRDDPQGFARKMNAMPKHVVSGTLTADALAWENSHLLAGAVAASVAELKAGDGGDILVAGSATLCHALTAADLVDEYRLMVFPIVLGSGRRLFATDAPAAWPLRLKTQRTLATGTQILEYVRER